MYYHGTTPDRIMSILREGLDPEKSKGECKAVYFGLALSDACNRNVAKAKAQLDQFGEMYIVEVDDDDLEGDFNPVYPDELLQLSGYKRQVFKYIKVVPPSAFRRIWWSDGQRFEDRGDSAHFVL